MMKQVVVVVAGLLLGLVTDTPAATRTWVGSTSTNFATAANWSAAFLNGDAPTFNAAGTAGRILYNNLAVGTTMGLITFNTAAPAYTINGNAITLGKYSHRFWES